LPLCQATEQDRLCQAQLAGAANCPTPVTCRAARGALGWTQKRLADKAHCSVDTVRALEQGATRMHRNHISALRAALQATGVVFVTPFGETGGVSSG
jgi:transcriptional regulator with XRE-family HTH domain